MFCLSVPAAVPCQIYIFRFTRYTERIVIIFSGGNRYREHIKWLHSGGNWNRDNIRIDVNQCNSNSITTVTYNQTDDAFQSPQWFHDVKQVICLANEFTNSLHRLRQMRRRHHMTACYQLLSVLAYSLRLYSSLFTIHGRSKMIIIKIITT